MKFTIGTRGSRLALIQTEEVIKHIKEKIPKVEIEIKVIKTIGDKERDKPLMSINEKGIFEKELGKALLKGEVDIAVHSMKDVPITQSSRIINVAVPKRGSPQDALVSRQGLKLKDLPRKAIIGTGSPRRKAQILHIRPDLEVKSIRGNVDTRVKKLEEGLYDALILAQVGLQRLDMEDRMSERLPLEDFVPSPGQGALAVVATENNERVIHSLKMINHPPSRASVLAERTFHKEMGGGCKVPIGALAHVRNNKLLLRASVLSPEGKKRIEYGGSGDLESPEKLGCKVAREIKKAGATYLIKHWRREHEGR